MSLRPPGVAPTCHECTRESTYTSLGPTTRLSRAHRAATRHPPRAPPSGPVLLAPLLAAVTAPPSHARDHCRANGVRHRRPRDPRGTTRSARSSDGRGNQGRRNTRPALPPHPRRARQRRATLDPLPEDGAPLHTVLEDVAPILAGGIRLGDPNCVAHLHPAPLISAAAAELAVGVTNQSMDAFDASPAGTFVEDALVARLAQLHGLGETGSGVMTMGGTASNLLGLLLARDRAGENVRTQGLPPNEWRIVASQAAHDSVRRSAALLGLGTEAVIGIPTDATGAMRLDAIERTRRARDRDRRHGGHDRPRRDRPARRARRQGAGTRRVVPRRRRRRLRAHALRPPPAPPATGSSAPTASPRTCTSCGGCRSAPARCSCPTSAALRAVHHASVYLNRPEDEAEGQLNLVGRSLDTSRRFDALKVLIALRTTGRRRLGEMVDAVLDAHAVRGRRHRAPARARARRAAGDGHGRVPPRAAATRSTSASTARCSRPARP